MGANEGSSIPPPEQFTPIPTDTKGRQPLDIQDFLEASSDASKRTRTMIIAMLVACVLTFAALLNSIQTQWLHLRMRAVGDINSPYVESKLGRAPSPASLDRHLYEERYIRLCDALEKAYVDASFVIRVPFFGISFDVNDLGLFGSAGFFLILTCYRFFLSRELDNLHMSFAAARSIGVTELNRFYQLLSMRQVFTIPSTPYTTRHTFPLPFRRVVSKLITFFPLALLVAVIWNDNKTRFILAYLGPEAESHFRWNLGFELTLMTGIAWLSIAITRRLKLMDDLWEETWKEINAPRPTGESFTI